MIEDRNVVKMALKSRKNVVCNGLHQTVSILQRYCFSVKWFDGLIFANISVLNLFFILGKDCFQIQSKTKAQYKFLEANTFHWLTAQIATKKC